MKTHRFVWGALLAALSVASCIDDPPASTVDAGARDGATSSTTRSIRGKAPLRMGAQRITRVNVIDAKTGRTIGNAAPDAQGNFVVNNVPKGATYKITFTAGTRAVPLVFAKARGNAQAKTNLFKVGTKTATRTGTLDGPIDLGDLSASMSVGEEQISPMNADNAPNNQEDYDEDGMPDAQDGDADGDGTPNEMDADNDGDGMPDNTAFGDQDGDGITNESDPDMDGDGMPNAQDPDNDNDGTPDAMDTTPNGNTPSTPEDSDGDGVPNSEDTTDPDDGDVEAEGDGGAHSDASAHGGEDVPPDPPFMGCTDTEYVHSTDPHWSYMEESEWPTLANPDAGAAYPMCMGAMMQQTPVDLSAPDGGAFTDEANALTFTNYGNVPLRILNNGHTVQVNFDGPFDASAPQVQIGTETYYLVQFHGHTQSEHTVGGQHRPMEWHFVHSTTGRLDGSGSIAVIGVFFNTPTGGTANAGLQSILDRAPRNELRRTCASDTVNLTALFPANRSYYHYAPGSLTTPPCTKGLNWFVMSTPVDTSAAQATRLLERIGGHENARSVQPLGARTIFRYTQP